MTDITMLSGLDNLESFIDRRGLPILERKNKGNFVSQYRTLLSSPYSLTSTKTKTKTKLIFCNSKLGGQFHLHMLVVLRSILHSPYKF